MIHPEEGEGAPQHTHVAETGAFAAAKGFDQPVLHYFPARGKAEPIRLCLAYQHIEWFEPPIDLAGEGDAPLERVYRCQLDGYPFRQLPRYVDGDVDIVGSMAILRHLGRKHALYGCGLAEAAAVDMAIDGVVDLRGKLRAVMLDQAMEPAAVAEYIATTLAPLEEVPQFVHVAGPMLAGLEQLAAAADPPHSPWLVTQRLSIADMAAFDLMDMHLQHAPLAAVVAARFPALMRMHAAVASQPGIARYLASDSRHAEMLPTKYIN